MPSQSPQRLILLHGFTGSASSFHAVMQQLPAHIKALAYTLYGHYPNAALPAHITDFIDMVDALAADIQQLAIEHLVGYSLGARLVLGMLLRHPHMCKRATLISVNPGLQSKPERCARRTADLQWEQLLEQDNIHAFATRWHMQPILKTYNQANARIAQHLRLQHDPKALLPIFRATSLAAMPNYWPDLPRIKQHVHFIAGMHDIQFSQIATQAAASTPHARLTLLHSCGHNPLIDAPQALAEALMLDT